MTRLNLVVIRAFDMERAVLFYRLLGLTFLKHRHGSGPEHHSAECNGLVFEIYPRQDETDTTTATRLGFQVQALDVLIADLKAADVKILVVPKDSQWGRRAVVQDPDGHRVELTETTSTTPSHAGV